MLEAIAIGQRHDDDTQVVLFREAGGGPATSTTSCARGSSSDCGAVLPRHVLAKMIAVADLPRT